MSVIEHGIEAIDHAIKLVADEILEIDADGGYLLNVTWLAADSELLTKLIDWRNANQDEGLAHIGLTVAQIIDLWAKDYHRVLQSDSDNKGKE